MKKRDVSNILYILYWIFVKKNFAKGLETLMALVGKLSIVHANTW